MADFRRRSCGGRCDVRLASRAELSLESYYRRLWIAVVNERYSRREFIKAMEDVIYSYPGRFCDEHGRPIPMPDLSEIFPDPDGRWVSIFKASDAAGINPARICLRTIPRLQMFDLYFKIAKPQVARHFGV